jgi:hypothetical protein
MISEIPCTEIPIEASESCEAPEAEAEPASQLALEPAENEPAEPLEGAAEPPTPKRKPGRPRKKEASGSSRAEREAREQSSLAPPPPVAKPKAPRKPARPESARGMQRGMVQEPLRALPADPFRATLDNMSAGQLVAELVHRRRAADKEMKQNLYRSFVM